MRMRPLIFSLNLLHSCVSGVSHTRRFLVRATVGTSLHVQVCHFVSHLCPLYIIIVTIFQNYQEEVKKLYERSLGAWQGGGQQRAKCTARSAVSYTGLTKDKNILICQTSNNIESIFWQLSFFPSFIPMYKRISLFSLDGRWGQSIS